MSAQGLPAREAMEFDVVVVGAGPAGLAAAIRLKQIAPEASIVVVEKGSEVGAHILSGAVIDPIGLDRLLPGWRAEDSPLKTKVSEDSFYWLSAARALRARRGSRAAKIRPRSQGALGGCARKAPGRPGAAYVRLAARQRHRRRLVPLPFRRPPGLGWIRGPPQLSQSLSVALRRVSAL